MVGTCLKPMSSSTDVFLTPAYLRPITEFGPMERGKYYLKAGRTTDVTAAICNGASSGMLPVVRPKTPGQLFYNGKGSNVLFGYGRVRNREQAESMIRAQTWLLCGRRKGTVKTSFWIGWTGL